MRDDLLPTAAKKTKVAIVGFSDSRRLTPFDDPAWETWGLNELYKLIPRWDRWFELHQRQVNLQDEGPGHIWKLSGFACPVYMQRHYDDVPSSVPYPLEKVLKRFRPYLTSSFSFMAALAIVEGFEEIGVFGVDVADEEWGSQRPSLEYLLGYAEGAGVKVTVPKESSLLRAPFLYGYQQREEQEFFGKLLNEEREYKRLADDAAEEMARQRLRAARAEGAVTALRNLRAEWRLPFEHDGFEQAGDTFDSPKDKAVAD